MDVLGRIRHAIVSPAESDGGDANTTPQDLHGAANVPRTPSDGMTVGQKRRTVHTTAVTFRDTWLKIRNTLILPDQAALHHGIERTSLKAQFQTICDLLVFEANRADEDVDIAGPCMEMLLEGDILGQLVKLTANDRISGSQAQVVGLFGSLIILLDERFLSRQVVHRSLVRLLRICTGEDSSNAASATDLEDIQFSKDEEMHARRRFGRKGSAESLGFTEILVELMCHTASRLRNSPELLIIFFRERGGDEQSRRAFNAAMSGASNAPSRGSTRASSPLGTVASPLLQVPRSSQPTVSSPLRPLDASPILMGSSLSTNARIESYSETSSIIGLPYDFPLFSYLMRFIHRESRTGELARAGVLFLVDVAFAPGRRNLFRSRKGGNRVKAHRPVASPSPFDKMPRSPRESAGRRSGTATPQKSRREVDLGSGPGLCLARFVTESDFTEVLGAGLGAVYGLLPTKLKLSRPSGVDASDDLIGDLAHGDDAAKWMSGDGIASLSSFYAALPADSMSIEVRDQMRLLCDILEFIQDILHTTSRETKDSEAASSSKEAISAQQFSSELKGIAHSFSINLHNAVQTLFLDSILYPSMLECSDHDGSATAVLTYLDAILSVLLPDGELAQCIVTWLIGADGKEGEQDGTITGRSKRRKRKSTALLQLERQKVAAEAVRTSMYFSDVHGRYTIRDLIVDNAQPTVQSSATVSAFRLASTLFTFHGRYVLRNVMQAEEDNLATSFPSSMNRSSGEGGDVSNSLGDIQDSGGFIFPGKASESEDAEQCVSAIARDMTCERKRASTLREARRYLNLVGAMQSGSSNNSLAEEESTTSQSTDFDRYLADAEVGVRRDSMYATAVHLMLHPTVSRDRDAEATASPIWRHRISTNDRLIRVTLNCFCHFWTNSPSVNVALSGFLAALMSCPLRSLDGLVYATGNTFQAGLGGTGGDDAIRDNRASLDVKQSSSMKQLASKTSGHSEPVLLCLLQALVETFNALRATITGFDDLFRERRCGLLFFENLDEVLDVGSTRMTDEDGEVADPTVHSPLTAFKSFGRRGSAGATRRNFKSVEIDHHIARRTSTNSTIPLILPLPPSATLSNEDGNGSTSRQPIAKASEKEPSTFARFFGRKKTTRSRSKDANTMAFTPQSDIMPKPFAQHYLRTAQIAIEVFNVQLSKSSPWCGTAYSSSMSGRTDAQRLRGASNGDVTEKRTRFKQGPEDDDVQTFIYPGEDSREASETVGLSTATDTSSATVSLSLLLNNAVILEELIKELVAIILVRRAHGIDVDQTYE